MLLSQSQEYSELDLEDQHDDGLILSYSCSQGHRSSLNLQTQEGGSICLVCFSNLVSNAHSPTIHVSYALSQLSRALSQPHFLNSVLTFHPHFLVSPLIAAISSFDDEPIACQVIDLILALCASDDASVYADFVTSVSDRLASGDLGWSCRQLYMLHCFGVLLKCDMDNPCAHIKDIYSLIYNLVIGLQLPSEKIRGEILFILYKVSILQNTTTQGDGSDVLICFCPKLLYFLGDALMKTQNDDVRLNCVALLTMLARRHIFREACAYDTGNMTSSIGDNYKETEDETRGPSLGKMFAEAVKGPLLSSDSQVQISTLDLLFQYLSTVDTLGKHIQVLVEENIADYVFEILRLSGYKDPAVKMCLKVLDLLSTAEEAFKVRLVVGVSTLIPVLCYVAEVPFHPVQCETLKLILKCISECPGSLSTSQLEELILVLTRMLRKHSDGEIGMLPETFILACSVLLALIRSPSCRGALDVSKSIEAVLKHAVSICLSVSGRNANQILHCLYLLQEAYAYSHEESPTNNSKLELRSCILDICKTHLLPWFVTGINEMEEETILGLLETFHSVLLLPSNDHALEFAKTLISSSWFSFSYGCLGLFTGDKMKCRIYLLLGSLVDVLLGNDSGQPIREATSYLPSDPLDLLFLLGQRSTSNPELPCCQSAVLMILYTSSLYDERLADEKLILASIEQYILVNSSDFQHGTADSLKVTQLVNLYGLLRGLCDMIYQIPYSREAERILFQLINEDGWDLVSARFHSVSLKWLFQQKDIIKSMCHQILKLSGSYSSEGADIIMYGNNNPTVNVETIAELVSFEDNYGARILICLLTKLIEEEGQGHGIISVLNLMATVIDICPAAADQLCLHGIVTVIRNLCYSSHTFLTTIFMPILVLIFKILSSFRPETLSSDQSWIAVTMKMVEYSVLTETADILPPQSLFVFGILSLILHQCTNKALEEASKAILFNPSMISMVHTIVYAACLKGPALFEHDERTSAGETLVSVLLLVYFAFKSLHAIPPGVVDWQSLLITTNPTVPLAFISIHCHDLSRLLHFGSPVIKIIASYILLELFIRLSDQINSKHEELKCTTGCLMSIKCVLEGLIFDSDLRVATNCAVCLSMLLGWESTGMETIVFGKSSWCRFITEEMTMSLAASCITSPSFIYSQKPALHLVIALLRHQKVPSWMRSVFNHSCISGILENLAACSLSPEMLVLFRELVKSDFLNTKQIATLNQVLQECRKCMYTNNAHDSLTNESIKKVVSTTYNVGEVCGYLLHLMLSETCLDMESWGLHSGNKRLLEEIELYFRTLAVDDHS